MTNRLYYRDPGLREFEALVVSSTPALESGSGPGAARWWVVLDRTAFYPTSGGQPHDTGYLGEARVIDVFEAPDNRIVHVTDLPLAPGPVRGAIEFERRFDHMQQHTGSHVLSSAFLRLYGIPAVSFHLGREISTIDVASQSLSQDQFQAIERACNEVILQDLPVTARMDRSTDLATAVPHHRTPQNKMLRIVEIQGWDAQPCGGTHVASTSQIGVMLLRRLTKARANFRIEFVCGTRAAQVAQRDFAALRETSQQLSCTFTNLPVALAGVLAERDACLGSQERLREQMATLNADLLRERQAKAGERGLVVHIFDNQDFQYLKLVALRLIEYPGTIALLGSRPKGAVVFAQAAGLQTDMHALLRSVLSEGGKGGGTREFAQGMVKQPADLEISLARASEQLGQGLAPGLSKLQKAREAGFGKLRWASALGD